jgi:hypothetical protein
VQRYLVALHCIPCQTERLHNVTYLGSVFASATCTVCGETLRPRLDTLVTDYVRDFQHRLARKPSRMLDVARRRPLAFMFHYLPRGLVTKPREVLEEWETLVRMNTSSARGTAEASAKEAKPTSVTR